MLLNRAAFDGPPRSAYPLDQSQWLLSSEFLYATKRVSIGYHFVMERSAENLLSVLQQGGDIQSCVNLRRRRAHIRQVRQHGADILP